MKILISGARGFIGSHLQEAMEGDFPFLIDDESHPAVPIEKRTRHFLPIKIADYCRASTIYFDLIIHCASPVGPASLTPEREVLWSIVEDTKALLDFAYKHKSKLILFSSSEVYGGGGGLREESTICVQRPFDTRAEYQVGKLAMESMAMAHPHPWVQIIRPTNVVGPRQRADGGFVLARFIEQAKAGKSLTVFGGEQRRTFMHVSDVVSFVMKLREEDSLWEQKNIWNLSNPANTTRIGDLAVKIANLAGSPRYRTASGQDELGPHWRDVPEKFLNIDKALSTGWEPKVSLDEIIKELLSGKRVHHLAR